MATGSIPHVGTRVSVQMFAGDVLAHQNLILVETYPGAGYLSVVFSDGAGCKVAITGDRSSLRLLLSAASAQLGTVPDPDPDPDPPGQIDQEPEAE
jgi:hypothetical protein